MYRGYLAYRVEDDNIIPASDNENEGQGKGLLDDKSFKLTQNIHRTGCSGVQKSLFSSS